MRRVFFLRFARPTLAAAFGSAHGRVRASGVACARARCASRGTCAPLTLLQREWVLLSFVPKTEKIRVKETGQGLDALKDELSDGSIYWAYIRWGSNDMAKFVYISWCGEGVTGTVKGKFSMHALQMQEFFDKSGIILHVAINARREADLDEKDLSVKVSRAQGVSYDKAQGDKSIAGRGGGLRARDSHLFFPLRPLPTDL